METGGCAGGGPKRGPKSGQKSIGTARKDAETGGSFFIDFWGVSDPPD